MADSQTSVYQLLRHDVNDSAELELTDYRSDNPQEPDGNQLQGERSSLFEPEVVSIASLRQETILGVAEPSAHSERPTYGNSPNAASNNATITRARSALQKIGKWTVIILLATVILTLAIFSFLAFLWAAPHSNNFWHAIIVEEWANRAVTASALLLRTAVDFQAGTAVAMLAAIFLESDIRILLLDTAQVSKLRAGRAMPLDLALPFWGTIRHGWGRTPGLYAQLLAVPLLITTTILLQFTSTVLISDLSLGVLPGKSQNESRNIDFMQASPTHGLPSTGDLWRTWFSNPREYPTFGEFSKAVETSEHVDDTGHLLRALLPLHDAQSRETISHYSGRTVVMDARVSCQRPELRDLKWKNVSSVVQPYLHVEGNFVNTEQIPALLGTPRLPARFECDVGEFQEGNSISICQVGRGEADGLLQSDLWDRTYWGNETQGTRLGGGIPQINAAHLVFNMTYPSKASEDHRPVPNTIGHGAWNDFIATVSQGDVDMSVSLCYPALWTTVLDVELYSSQNRTEPVATSNLDGWHHTDPDVHIQMGETEHAAAMTAEARGILTLSPKDSWLPDPADDLFDPEWFNNSFIVNALTLKRANPVTSTIDGKSVAWRIQDKWEGANFSPDARLGSIFTTSLLNTNGSAARALSTLITILASGAYYEQMPNFDKTAKVTAVSFEPFLFPQSFRGFTAVLVVTILHCLLVLFIIVSFIVTTRLTTIGDHWQSIAQVVSPVTESFLARCTYATDKEIAKDLGRMHREREFASVEQLSLGEGRVGLVAQVVQRRTPRSDEL